MTAHPELQRYRAQTAQTMEKLNVKARPTQTGISVKFPSPVTTEQVLTLCEIMLLPVEPQEITRKSPRHFWIEVSAETLRRVSENARIFKEIIASAGQVVILKDDTP